MGFFDSTSISTTQQTEEVIDARVGIEGGGEVVGQGAVVGSTGGITTRAGDFSPLTQLLPGASKTSTGAFSPVTQAIDAEFRMGMSGAEVLSLLQNEQAASKAMAQSVSDFGTQALDAVSQASTGEGTKLSRYAPYAVVLLIAVAAIKAGAR